MRPPYKRILEIGYGSGVLMPTLSKIGHDVFGVDIISDPDRTTMLLNKFGVNVTLFKDDICDWKAGSKKFDLVVAFSILEHITSPSKALQNISALLEPNGTLLVGMPRVDKFMVPLFSLIGYPGIEDHHVTTYKEVIRHAIPYFQLQSFMTFPSFVPRWAGLYFNMVFAKLPASEVASRT